MKDILIVSATLRNNYTLANQLKDFLDDMGVSPTVISLENFILPLYTDDVFDKEKDNYKETIESLTKLFIDNDGLIICAPEYNGSSPPILNNAIAWISTTTDYWRDAFKDKTALIATSSGGSGTKFAATIKTQLEHLGCTAISDLISANSSHPLDTDSAKKILQKFISLL